MAKSKNTDGILKSTESLTISLYAVRNSEGKWLRSKGQSGSGRSWVDDLSNAKIWTKSAPAKAQITFWANHFPQYGVPDLIRMTSATFEVLDQEQRVIESTRKRAIEEVNLQIQKYTYYLDVHFDDRSILTNYRKKLDDALEKRKQLLSNS